MSDSKGMNKMKSHTHIKSPLLHLLIADLRGDAWTDKPYAILKEHKAIGLVINDWVIEWFYGDQWEHIKHVFKRKMFFTGTDDYSSLLDVPLRVQYWRGKKKVRPCRFNNYPWRLTLHNEPWTEVNQWEK